MITVALVDDDPMVRAGSNFILKGEDGIDVAWRAGNGAGALTKLRDRPVSVVLLDVQIPGLDGLATLGELRGWQTRLRVIVLTTLNIDNYVMRALKLGADTFLLRGADPTRLVEAIQRVAAGENAPVPDMTHTLIIVATNAPAAGGPSARVLVTALTEREHEVAILMAQELTNSQIGTHLRLSLASVKSHLISLFVKLGVDNRVSAAMVTRDAGL